MGRGKPKKDKKKQQRHEFRMSTKRHTLVIEADMTEDQKRHCFRMAENLRVLSNYLTHKADVRLKQLFRRRDYKKTLKDYGEAKSSGKEKELDKAKASLKKLQKAEGLSVPDFYNAGKKMAAHYQIPTIFLQTISEDVFRGVKECLYNHAEKLHYKKRGNLPVLRAKTTAAAIIPKLSEGRLIFKTAFAGEFGLKTKPGDVFVEEELTRIIAFMADPQAEDRAVKAFFDHGELTDTFRICYVSLKCQMIRGRLRVFVHLSLEGKALSKKNKDGSPRHRLGSGKLGLDWGVQSFAGCSEDTLFFENLAERGPGTEEKIKGLQRRLDRSQRATNSCYYNENGTIKKGKKNWVRSKRWKKLSDRRKDLQRKAAVNRRLAVNETVNRLRSFSEVVITEDFDGASLKRKAPFDESEPNKKRKRFGHSLLMRCPGFFLSRLKEVFCATGGKVRTVSSTFRASQYDHKADRYTKKDLSERLHHFEDGQEVARDLYSAFLLFCSSEDFTHADRQLCIKAYPGFYENYSKLLEQMKKDKKTVMNSGITV